MFSNFNNHCHRKHETVPESPEHPLRLFNPRWNELYDGTVASIIGQCRGCLVNKIKLNDASTRPNAVEYEFSISENALESLTRSSGSKVDGNSIVVAIDGACRDNGRANARASIGIFWGRGSNMNRAELLDSYQPQTNQIAEVCAAIEALDHTVESFKDRMKEGGGLQSPDCVGFCLPGQFHLGLDLEVE